MKSKTKAELEIENRMLRDEVESLRKMVFEAIKAPNAWPYWYGHTYTIGQAVITGSSDALNYSSGTITCYQDGKAS